MPGPGAAAGAKAASAAGARVGAGAASRSGTAQAAKGGGSAAAARSGGGAARGGGTSGGRGGDSAARARSLGRLTSFRARRKRKEGDEEALFSSTASRGIAVGAIALFFFLIVIVAPVLVLEASANSCGGEGEEEEAVPIQTNHQSDPEDLSETQIAIRIYLVGQVMNMTPRQIITAYAVGYVESTMHNLYGGDRDSVGVFQQRNFSPWTDGGRNRNNVIDASISFFLQLKRLDEGQPIPILAADVQQPAEEYRYRYGLWVDEATGLYERIKNLIGSAAGVKTIQSLKGVTISGAGLDSLTLGAACSALTATGPANLKQADTVYHPRSYKTLPSDVWDYGFGEPDQVDTRIWPNAVWIMRNYHLKATAGRETGHSTHGDGTALDMIPAQGSSQKAWDSTARKLALDLGWTPGCAANGFAKSAGGLCNFVPAIILIGYNGFSDGNHGDPAHTGSPHIHVSWHSSCYGCGGGALVPPRDWVKVFPVGPEAQPAAPSAKNPARNGARRGGRKGARA